MKYTFHFLIACFAILFCASSVFGQWKDTCTHLKSWEVGQPANEAEYKKQYDTLRLYVEKCATTDPLVAGAFRYIINGAQFSSDDSTRFDSCRTWLISVLFLNTFDEDYFCSDIGAIASTYQYGKWSPLAHLSVLNYLRQYHRSCWNSAGDKGYATDSAADAHIQIGEYSVNNLPPLDSIGLGFLIHENNASSPTTNANILASFISIPNPFIKETTLEFDLNRTAYTTIAIYDELGRLVWGDGKGSSLDAGRHTVHIDGKPLPHGTLYARISTVFGEVKTVKLVHE